MEKKYVKVDKGVWDLEARITEDQWKVLLRNPKVLNDKSFEMLRLWYLETDHLASSHLMAIKHHPENIGAYYNGVVAALGKRILLHLPEKFEVIDPLGEACYFVLIFKGYRETKKKSSSFIWEMHPELVSAVEELRLFDGGALGPPVDNDLISVVADKEGKRLIYYSTRYERSAKNREAAILARGTICEACGFDFEKAYGKIGSGFIEVHHIKPLCSLDGEEIPINPKEDMVCVCANCHRMLHRHGDILTIEQLKKKMRSAIAGHKPRG